MLQSDALWVDKWSKAPFTTRIQDYYSAVKKLSDKRNFQLFGTDQEPGSSVWLASLSEAMGDSFCEGMTVLDYGSGAGRYAQFMRQRLKSFQYYGLEKPGSSRQHGEKSIKAGRKLFRWDRRIKFDMIGSRLEAKALANASVVVLGSVFTHVDFCEMQNILAKFKPLVARDGKIVFSIFIADAYGTEDHGSYGMENCYNRVWFTADQLQGLCGKFGWALNEKESFVAHDQNLHRIFSITRV
jgi:cyclopropane fatty-acyl-phospholipid synthase-like methyltransferase